MAETYKYTLSVGNIVDTSEEYYVGKNITQEVTIISSPNNDIANKYNDSFIIPFEVNGKLGMFKSGSNIYENYIIVEMTNASIIAYLYSSYDVSKSELSIKLGSSPNTLFGNVNTSKEITSSYSSGVIQDISNPLIMNEEQATISATYIKDILNYVNEFYVYMRTDPRIEVGDYITLSLDDGSTINGFVVSIDMIFSETLRSKLKIIKKG